MAVDYNVVQNARGYPSPDHLLHGLVKIQCPSDEKNNPLTQSEFGLLQAWHSKPMKAALMVMAMSHRPEPMLFLPDASSQARQ